MSLKVHLPTGDFVCPKCGAIVKESDKKCPKCGEPFEGVREGKRCPNCGTINDIDAAICASCGYSFEKAATFERSDEEFLQKLLNWSKTLAEKENEEYQEEAEQVVNVFKKVTGLSLENAETEGEVDWKRKIQRNREFLKSMMELLEEEKSGIERKADNSRKKETKRALEEEADAIGQEIKGLRRAYEDLEDIEKWFDGQIERLENEGIEKERELRKEIAKVRKESISREEELRNHINEQNAEIEQLRKRLAESAGAESLLNGWISLESRIEEELKGLEAKEKDEKISDYIFETEKEMKTILDAIRMRAQEEEELKRLLKVLDDLFDALPDRIVKKFAESEDFGLYERILDRYHVGE